jgi:hypothetical protein
MSKAAFHSAGKLDIELFVNKFRVQRFEFLVDSVELPVTGFTWQLVIKQNRGAIENLISLTLGNGLSFPVYETNVIEARFSSTDTNIPEGKYAWFLIRTDTNEVWLNGEATFAYGFLDSSASEQDVTVNLSDETVTVNLYSIVYSNTENPGMKIIQVACSDETTAITATTNKITFRAPQAMTVTAVRASLTTPQTSGNIFTVDIHKNGTTILSTKITIDNGEETSVTAATQPVISVTSIADDDEITVDVDQIGDSTAKGLKVAIIGS